jgi:hypothetical protein
MTEGLKKQFKEEIEKLPREKQEAIAVFDWVNKTAEIGRSFSFSEDEINNLQLETGLVLFGLVDLNLFALNIENNIVTSKDVSEKIAKEIFDKIFTPIVNKMEIGIKSKLGSRNPSWDERVNFIVSGGDYSVFIDK